MTKRRSRVKLPPRDIMRGKQYPGVRGKVVDCLGGHFKSGQWGTGQNRPTDVAGTWFF